jgi:hypothetical protein
MLKRPFKITFVGHGRLFSGSCQSLIYFFSFRAEKDTLVEHETVGKSRLIESESGLPDFSSCKHTKTENISQMGSKYTMFPQS